MPDGRNSLLRIADLCTVPSNVSGFSNRTVMARICQESHKRRHGANPEKVLEIETALMFYQDHSRKILEN